MNPLKLDLTYHTVKCRSGIRLTQFQAFAERDIGWVACSRNTSSGRAAVQAQSDDTDTAEAVQPISYHWQQLWMSHYEGSSCPGRDGYC